MLILEFALGGNALIKPEERGIVKQMLNNLKISIKQIIELSKEPNIFNRKV